MRHMKNVLRVSLLLVLLASLNLAFPQSDSKESHTNWIAASLREIKTIEVGMTRENLLKVFTTEGGLSTRLQQTYVLRECPYIKVEVEFEPVESKENLLTKYPGDRIVKISKPFLESSITD